MDPLSKQYALALYNTLADKNQDDSKTVIREFIGILNERGALGSINDILCRFSQLWASERGIVEAEIKSAEILNKQALHSIEEYVIQAAGAKTVKISNTVEPSLIGGAVIRYGDKLVDLSLRSRIAELRKQMTR